MTFVEAVGLLFFTGAIGAVYVVAVYALVRQIIFRQPNGPRSKIAYGLSLFGLACFAYGYWVEPYWPQVRVVRLESSKIPAGAGVLRFVQLSDFHSDARARLEERLIPIIAAEHPDFIFFTGDSINSREALPVFRAAMTHLAHIAPIYTVKGNWDVGFWSTLERFDGTGATELLGHVANLQRRGASLAISGLPISLAPNIVEAFKGATPGAFRIFLYHYPDEIYQAADAGVDLYMAGHTHGGQVALPFYGALITLSRYGKRFEAGLYRVKDTWLYVNRGIGMEGGIAPRVRFLVRPEITVYEIKNPNAVAQPIPKILS